MESGKSIIFKYIITKRGAILFNEVATHIQVAHGFKESGEKIYSAGFVPWWPGMKKFGMPYGKSDSLKIESNPEIDFIIIGDLFNPVSRMKYFGGFDFEELYKK